MFSVKAMAVLMDDGGKGHRMYGEYDVPAVQTVQKCSFVAEPGSYPSISQVNGYCTSLILQCCISSWAGRLTAAKAERRQRSITTPYLVFVAMAKAKPLHERRQANGGIQSPVNT
jgi:hypothetical protein